MGTLILDTEGMGFAGAWLGVKVFPKYRQLALRGLLI